MELKQKFQKYLGLPSKDFYPVEVENAQGIFIVDKYGNKYIDLCSGIGVNNLGHKNPLIINRIQKQLEKYLHVMVYGEIVIPEQVEYAEALVRKLPKKLNKVFFVNSGSEAIEGALKIAKKFTAKSEIIAFKNSYHGSTAGAFSIMYNENLKRGYRPLLPNIRFLEFNNLKDLEQITDKTCCIVMEMIQAEAGVIEPTLEFLTALKQKCKEHNCLIILDEVQTGFGRTGTLFAFEQYNFEPDILVLAKAMGGGLPLGAFISSEEIMHTLQNPPLGHITTYGGNPLSVVAGKAVLDYLFSENIIENVHKKGQKIIEAIKNHKNVVKITGKGLLYAVYLENEQKARKFIDIALNKTFLITDIFLFRPNAFRIAPPLTITDSEIQLISEKLIETLDLL